MANNYFSSQGTTVTTYAWTKLHAQIISWVSSVYESHLCMALNCSNHNCHPWFAQLWAILKCLQLYKQVSYHVCFQELINSWCFNFIHPCFRLHSGSSLHQLGSYSLVFLSTVSIENGYARPPCDNTDTTSEYYHCQKLNSVAVMMLISVAYW